MNFNAGSLFRLFIVATSGIVFSGCATTSEKIEKRMSYDLRVREKLKNGPVKLPNNVVEQTNPDPDARPVIVVGIKKIIALRDSKDDADLKKIAAITSTKMLGDMVALKRFTTKVIDWDKFEQQVATPTEKESGVVVNRNGFEKTLQTLVEYGQLSATEKEKVSAIFQGEIKVTRTRTGGYDRDRINFYVKCSFLRIERPMTDTESIGTASMSLEGEGNVQVLSFYGSDGTWCGGHRPEDDQVRVDQAANLAIEAIFDQLGNCYPVGGKVTTCDGSTMELNIGSDVGMGSGQHVVVYAKQAGKPKYAIGYAQATLEPKISTLEVWRWNTDNPKAKTVIKEISKNYGEWASKPGNELRAVSYGMPREKDPGKKE